MADVHIGTTQTITLIPGQPLLALNWVYRSADFGDLGRSDNPNGYNLVPTTPTNDFRATIPANAPLALNVLVSWWDGSSATCSQLHVNFLPPLPPPTNTGFNLRDINLPFRRRRPAHRVQKF